MRLAREEQELHLGVTYALSFQLDPDGCSLGTIYRVFHWTLHVRIPGTGLTWAFPQ